MITACETATLLNENKGFIWHPVGLVLAWYMLCIMADFHPFSGFA
jgi:hypothetical protein